MWVGAPGSGGFFDVAGRGGDGVQNKAGKPSAHRGRGCGAWRERNWNWRGCGFAGAARREEEGVDGEHVPERAQDAGDGGVGGEVGDGEGFVQQGFEQSGVVGAVMGEGGDQPAAGAREADRRGAGAGGSEGAGWARRGAGGEVGGGAGDAVSDAAEVGQERHVEAGVAGVKQEAEDQAGEGEQDPADPAEQVGGGIGQGLIGWES